MGRGWKISNVKGPLNVEVRNEDGRKKMVYINRLRPYVQRERKIDSTITIGCEKTSSLRSSFMDEVRGDSHGETTGTLEEGTHNQSRLSTLPEVIFATGQVTLFPI